AARLRDQLGHREAALASLARPHAATQEGLHLIGSGAAERDRVDDLAGRYLLAAAYEGVTRGPAELRGRLIISVEKRTSAGEPRARGRARQASRGRRRPQPPPAQWAAARPPPQALRVRRARARPPPRRYRRRHPQWRCRE